jgi:hypothetical protein
MDYGPGRRYLEDPQGYFQGDHTLVLRKINAGEVFGISPFTTALPRRRADAVDGTAATVFRLGSIPLIQASWRLKGFVV